MTTMTEVFNNQTPARQAEIIAAVQRLFGAAVAQRLAEKTQNNSETQNTHDHT